MSEQLEKIQSEELKQFELSKKQALVIAEECKALTVTDEVTEAIGTQVISKAKSYIKDIDEKRAAIKKPYFEAGKKIDALAKELSVPLEDAIKIAGDKILAFKQEKEKARLEAIRKIENLNKALIEYSKETMKEINACNTEAELGLVYGARIKNFDKGKYVELGEESITQFLKQLVDYGKAKRQAIIKPVLAEAVEEVQEQKEEAVAEIIEETISKSLSNIEAKGTGIRKTWAFEIVDRAIMPTNWLMPDETAIKASMKKFVDAEKLKPGDDVNVNGVRFYQKETLSIR